MPLAASNYQHPYEDANGEDWNEPSVPEYSRTVVGVEYNVPELFAQAHGYSHLEERDRLQLRLLNSKLIAFKIGSHLFPLQHQARKPHFMHTRHRTICWAGTAMRPITQSHPAQVRIRKSLFTATSSLVSTLISLYTIQYRRERRADHLRYNYTQRRSMELMQRITSVVLIWVMVTSTCNCIMAQMLPLSRSQA